MVTLPCTTRQVLLVVDDGPRFVRVMLHLRRNKPQYTKHYSKNLQLSKLFFFREAQFGASKAEQKQKGCENREVRGNTGRHSGPKHITSRRPRQKAQSLCNARQSTKSPHHRVELKEELQRRKATNQPACGGKAHREECGQSSTGSENAQQTSQTQERELGHAARGQAVPWE